ncbi:MAG: M28 family peptidase [Verrucomicrobia bacterium]|nr:M28 family peptidase [Verrucomicrobiota bacterium]
MTVGFVACGPKQPSEIDWQAFSGKRAYAHVERIVGYGPRPTASPALIKTATYISTQLQEYGLDVEEQAFVAPTPRGPLQFRNVIGKTRTRRGSAGKIIIIGSHYDTKYLPSMHFVGANDSGSSSGALLEMARVTSGVPNLWFVFFDGEECVKEYGPNDGLWGSMFFVEDLKGKKQLDRIKAFILLDMMGDKDLHIVMPGNSHRGLVQRVFESAKATGHRSYFSFNQQPIMDDHVPFALAGVPTVDLIDFHFGSAPGLNDYWHTEQDTLDKISPRSLEIVGQTALHLVDSLRQNPRF